MRQQNQQTANSPDGARSGPVPVVPAPDPDATQLIRHEQDADDTITLERGSAADTGFHEPANQPTAFGAGTVGGAAAAAALASGVPADRRDPRDEETVRFGDGRVDEEETVRFGDGRGDATDAVDSVPDLEREPAPALVPTDTVQQFRRRWRDVQLRFVDDPRGAADDARQLAQEAIEEFTSALTRQKERLDQESATSDTEQLRMVVRGYRDVLERALGR